MGRPPKLLSNEKCEIISGDLEFARQMINTRNLTVDNLVVVLRHLDMVRADLVDVQKNRLKELRDRSRLTLQEVSILTGFSVPAISAGVRTVAIGSKVSGSKSVHSGKR